MAAKRKAAVKDETPKTPRKRRVFLESQLNAGQVVKALDRLGYTVTDIELEAAYRLVSNRRKAAWNDPEKLRARLAELDGRMAPANGAAVDAPTPPSTDPVEYREEA